MIGRVADRVEGLKRIEHVDALLDSRRLDSRSMIPSCGYADIVI
jgi:hypothetical protein